MDNLTLKTNNAGTEYIINDFETIVKKRCRNCGEMKVITDFNNDKKGLGGKTAQCRNCVNKRTKARRTGIQDKSKSMPNPDNTPSATTVTNTILKEMPLAIQELERKAIAKQIKRDKQKEKNVVKWDVKYAFIDNIITDFFKTVEY